MNLFISRFQSLNLFCLFSAFCLAATGAASADTKNPYARANFNTARQAIGVNNFRLGLVAADRSIAADPTNADAFYLRGRILEEMDENEKASQDFEKALKLNKAAASGFDYYWAANANFRENHFERGQQILETGIKLFPNSGTTSCMLFARRAMRSSIAGNDAAALKDLDRALALSDDYQSPRLQRARIYTKQGQYEKAIIDYTHIINKKGLAGLTESDISSSYKGRAICYGKLGKKDLQAADLKRLSEAGSSWAVDILK
jgi:tetratricopeptide (TPR) repeat protein